MSDELSPDERIAQAVADVRARAIEIVKMCSLYGHPEMAADEIRANTTISELGWKSRKRRASDDAAQTQPRTVDEELEGAAAARFAA